jgi:hypothetical protein
LIWSLWSRTQTPVLGLSQDALTEVLAGFPTTESGKPQRPKEALRSALRRSGRPHSARIFQELAERVSLQVHERAFDKLRQALQTWFPLEGRR